jgi:hypothetical protein
MTKRKSYKPFAAGLELKVHIFNKKYKNRSKTVEPNVYVENRNGY